MSLRISGTGLLAGSIRFEDGHLFASRPGRTVRLKAWPSPSARVGPDRERCRIPIQPRLGLLELEEHARLLPEDAASACHALLDRIPGRERALVSQFPEFAFCVLRLIWDAPHTAADLLESNPALGFAVAVSAELKEKPPGPGQSPVEMLGKKRPEILDWLEMPPTRSAARVLSRISSKTLYVRALRQVRALLATEDERKRLEHLEVINADALSILGDPALNVRVTPNFLCAASQLGSVEPHLAERLRDTLRNYHWIEPGRAFPLLDRLEMLDELSQRVRQMMARREAVRTVPFPAPPWPGNGNIEPITDADDLIDEGILQRNCAADYRQRIIERSHYLYRVAQPERCTLSLVRGPRGWVLEQLRSTYNTALSCEATRRIVRRWASENDRPP